MQNDEQNLPSGGKGTENQLLTELCSKMLQNISDDCNNSLEDLNESQKENCSNFTGFSINIDISKPSNEGQQAQSEECIPTKSQLTLLADQAPSDTSMESCSSFFSCSTLSLENIASHCHNANCAMCNRILQSKKSNAAENVQKCQESPEDMKISLFDHQNSASPRNNSLPNNKTLSLPSSPNESRLLYPSFLLSGVDRTMAVSENNFFRSTEYNSSDTRVTDSEFVFCSPAAAIIREKIAFSEKRVEELEKQVKQIPFLQVTLSVLREENRLLLLQLKAKSQNLNIKSFGVGGNSSGGTMICMDGQDKKNRFVRSEGQIVNSRLKSNVLTDDFKEKENIVPKCDLRVPLAIDLQSKDINSHQIENKINVNSIGTQTEVVECEKRIREAHSFFSPEDSDRSAGAMSSRKPVDKLVSLYKPKVIKKDKATQLFYIAEAPRLEKHQVEEIKVVPTKSFEKEKKPGLTAFEKQESFLTPYANIRKDRGVRKSLAFYYESPNHKITEKVLSGDKKKYHKSLTTSNITNGLIIKNDNNQSISSISLERKDSLQEDQKPSIKSVMFCRSPKPTLSPCPSKIDTTVVKLCGKCISELQLAMRETADTSLLLFEKHRKTFHKENGSKEFSEDQVQKLDILPFRSESEEFNVTYQDGSFSNDFETILEISNTIDSNGKGVEWPSKDIENRRESSLSESELNEDLDFSMEEKNDDPIVDSMDAIKIENLDEEDNERRMTAEESSQSLDNYKTRAEGDQVVSSDLVTACEVLTDYLLNTEKQLDENVKSAIVFILQKWFAIASSKNADPNEVRSCLDAFKEISQVLVPWIVNGSDSNGNTAMHFALSHSNLDVVHELLKTKCCNVNKVNKAGYTCIMLVSIVEMRNNSDKRILENLLRMGDVNKKASENGQTALMLAVSRGREDIVKMLLDAGADVNLQDYDGSTALMCAAEHGYINIAKQLLGHPDCDITLTDEDGNNAFNIALEAGHADVGLLLHFHKTGSRGFSPYTSVRYQKWPSRSTISLGRRSPRHVYRKKRN